MTSAFQKESSDTSNTDMQKDNVLLDREGEKNKMLHFLTNGYFFIILRRLPKTGGKNEPIIWMSPNKLLPNII